MRAWACNEGRRTETSLRGLEWVRAVDQRSEKPRPAGAEGSDAPSEASELLGNTVGRASEPDQALLDFVDIRKTAKILLGK